MFGGRGRYTRSGRWKQPSVEFIEKAVSKVADEYGYGNVWLFGNYYVGAYEDRDDIQVMLDASEHPRHTLAFSNSCEIATGLGTQVYLTDQDERVTEYILKNSKLIHHARTA